MAVPPLEEQKALLCSKGTIPLLATAKDCPSKSAGACYEEALAYYEGTGVAKDIKRARTLFEAACDLRDSISCFNAAVIARTGQAGETDEVRAQAFFRWACMLGDKDGCTAGCQLGDGCCCGELGFLVADGLE
jgi:TPR repeat protein